MASSSQLFDSYEQALSVCDKGYDDDELAKVVTGKTLNFLADPPNTIHDTDPIAVTAMAVGLARRGGQPVRVLDVGGAAGYHYFLIKRLLRDVPLSWAVVETDAMVRHASEAVRHPGLEFFTSVDAAVAHLGGCDLVYASGTVQCVPNPEQLLEQLLALAAPLMLITRFPLYEGVRTVGIQMGMLSHNGPGPMPAGIADKPISYPITFLGRSYVADTLLRSYDLAGQFLSPSANYDLAGRLVPGVSLLLRRR